MDTTQIKQGLLQSLYALLPDLSLEEIEDLKDALTAREHELTDDGERISLDAVLTSL